MGNRAVITTDNLIGNIGLYVHWNGGADTVLPVLEFIKQNHNNEEYKDVLKVVDKDRDLLKNIELIYKVAFGNKYEIKDYKSLDCDNFDNGVYVVDNKFKICRRKYFEGREQNEYDLNEMMIYISEKLKEYIFLKSNNLVELTDRLSNNFIKWEVIEDKLYIEYHLYDVSNPNLRRQLNDYKMVFDVINKSDDEDYPNASNGRRENDLIKLISLKEFEELTENKEEE